METSLIGAEKLKIGFLDLPLELRLQIYHEYRCLQPLTPRFQHRMINFYRNNDSSDGLSRPHWIFRDLLGVNQKLRSELFHHFVIPSKLDLQFDEALTFSVQSDAVLNTVRSLKLMLITTLSSREPILRFHTLGLLFEHITNLIQISGKMTNLERLEIDCLFFGSELARGSPVDLEPLLQHPRLESIIVQGPKTGARGTALSRFEEQLNSRLAKRNASQSVTPRM